jgi:hypothetical protein
MQLWLKSDKQHIWSLYQVNNIPTAINGWNIVMILAANTYVDATGRRMVVVVLNLVCSPPFQSHSTALSVHKLTSITGTPPLRNNLLNNLGSPLRPKNRFLPLRRHRRTTKSHLHVLGERSLFPRLSTSSLDNRDHEFVRCSTYYYHSAILVSGHRCAEV